MDRHLVARVGLTALALGAAFLAIPAMRSGATAAQACKDVAFRSDRGVEYRILFAKNGSVQQYLLVGSSKNMELDHDVRLQLERRYGEEAADAPPLRIISFRKGSGTMMVPDKAIDSCGRVTHFH
ncbi:MAG TPA: hypothetical protein VIG51_07545 [Candidatus Baltobacteraceae bacterium]|jgi:hypothetical protein